MNLLPFKDVKGRLPEAHASHGNFQAQPKPIPPGQNGEEAATLGGKPGLPAHVVPNVFTVLPDDDSVGGASRAMAAHD